MIVQKKFLENLRDLFNLNIYEAKIWTSLLSRGVSTASELSDIANVPRSRSYDVLESLEKKGYIIMKLGKPIKYIAIEPEEIIRRVQKQIGKDAKTKVELLEKVKSSDIFEELKALHNQEIEHILPEKLTGSILGRKEIYSSLRSAIGDAKKSISIVTTEEGLIRKSRALNAALKKASSRGIKIEVMGPITKDNQTHIKHLEKYGKLKHVDKINARYVIIDDEHLMIFMHNDKDLNDSYDMAIWVKTPLFGKAIKELMSF
jgi:HTH-type transcriptional regulator, sugar sensing transcriptional regulator